MQNAFLRSPEIDISFRAALAAARLTAGDGFESSETISVQAEVLPSLPISTALFRSASPTAIGYFAATT
jgi:hypothetical protein